MARGWICGDPWVTTGRTRSRLPCNGQPEAADYLASRGAPLDLESASGLGRVDEVKRLIDRVTRKEVLAAFSLACAYGRAPVIDFVLAHGGVDVDAELKESRNGHTGLHVAAFHGQAEAVKVLLQHGANLHAIDKTWNTPPLLWALTGWQRSGHGGRTTRWSGALSPRRAVTARRYRVGQGAGSTRRC